MNDSIEKDDEKFNDLITKQHPTLESFTESLKPVEDSIENDDNKMDDLLYLQSLSEEISEHATLEEKYEEEILIDQVTKMFDNDFRKRREADSSAELDPFAQFFNQEEDERW